MKTAVRSLVTEIDYGVDSQDLRLPRTRIPTRPNSGVVISSVRRRSSPVATPDAVTHAGSLG